jgi:hypothetical protein
VVSECEYKDKIMRWSRENADRGPRPAKTDVAMLCSVSPVLRYFQRNRGKEAPGPSLGLKESLVCSCKRASSAHLGSTVVFRPWSFWVGCRSAREFFIGGPFERSLHTPTTSTDDA